jgi:hypothetical protein
MTPMAVKRPAFFACLIITVLVMVLGCGRGLPGIVQTMVGTEHVCTCVSGGTHASCPVCNPTLRHERRSHAPAFEGVPCGEGRLAVEGALDPALVPPSGVTQAASLSDVTCPPLVSGAPHDPFLEPLSRPPRFALPV